MTEKQLRRLYQKCIDTDHALMNALGSLGEFVSEIYGEDIIADICAGSEIEFRHVLNDGVADPEDTIRLEDVIERLRENK